MLVGTPCSDSASYHAVACAALLSMSVPSTSINAAVTARKVIEPPRPAAESDAAPGPRALHAPQVSWRARSAHRSRIRGHDARAADVPGSAWREIRPQPQHFV